MINKQESHSTAGHGFMGPLQNEPNWKKKRRETDTPNPVEPKPNEQAASKDQAVVDQNSFTNRLARNVKEERNKRKGSSDASEGGAAVGSAVGELALAMKGYGIGADFDELHQGGKKDKLPGNPEIEKKRGHLSKEEKK